MSTSSTAKPGANGSDNSKVPPPNETNALAEEERAFRASDEDLVAEQKLFDSNGAHTSLASDANGSGEMGKSHPYRFVPLKMGGGGGTHKATSKSSSLIDEIGGLPALVQMTTFFYANAFQDSVLDTFIRDHDEPHATRFARWVHQKLTDSSVWDEDRASRSHSPVTVARGQTVVVHDRSSAHVAAWNSPKRPAHEVGRRFKLDECRVWMRLHLWAMREVVGERSPGFVDYYVRFLGHFVAKYETRATMFARDSYRWSADPKNVEDYLSRGRKMHDVIGLTFDQALAQIPDEESYDDVWPYTRR